MASEKILSICIPTYNRAKALDRLLENLALETKGLSERLEICVSDNGSSDDTQKVFSRWKDKIPLRHRRNEKNLRWRRADTCGIWGTTTCLSKGL
jgi:glycosyltransferase involved in cell wall biosynthesis